MKLFSFILLLFLSFNSFAQKSGDVLATANGRDYTVADLAPEIRADFESLPSRMMNVRQSLLENQIGDLLFETEAAAQKTTVDKLIEKDIRAKTPAPTEAQIKAVYDANRAQIGDKTLAEVRPLIVNHLRREPEQKAFAVYLSNLKVKYKVALVKDVNAKNLAKTDVLATVGGKTITVETYETQNNQAISDFEADVYHHARESLEQTIYYNLVAVEAKAGNIETSDLIAREITDKLKAFTDDERAKLEDDLRQKLFQKYNAKFLIKEIPVVARNVSADDDPARGKNDAPVTVIMFSDFQCPACAGTHPILKQVLAEYADKVRFVVRDFPLITIHENAFPAAIAANAANRQGKFFEYVELLYQNQSNLDRQSLVRYAAELKLDLKRFEADLLDPQLADEVRKDLTDGKKLGINATPTVFVNGISVRELSAESFRRAVERALKN